MRFFLPKWKISKAMAADRSSERKKKERQVRKTINGYCREPDDKPATWLCLADLANWWSLAIVLYWGVTTRQRDVTQESPGGDGSLRMLAAISLVHQEKGRRHWSPELDLRITWINSSSSIQSPTVIQQERVLFCARIDLNCPSPVTKAERSSRGWASPECLPHKL